MQVIIIGGGIAGLSQALSLHQIGVPCRVYEAVPALSPLGYGINLQPNAIRELSALGLGEKLAAAGILTKELAFYNKHGVTAGEIFSGQSPAPPAAGQRFLDRLAQTTRTKVRSSPAPQADVPATTGAATSAAPAAGAVTAPASEPAKTFPMEDSNPGQEPPK